MFYHTELKRMLEKKKKATDNRISDEQKQKLFLLRVVKKNIQLMFHFNSFTALQ